MKFGVRKPNLKKSFKARTTGKLKRNVKSAINPLYGKKGTGLIRNPKKAVYNKVYNKVTVDPLKSVKKGSSTSKAKTLPNQGTYQQENINGDNNVYTDDFVLYKGIVYQSTTQKGKFKHKVYAGISAFFAIYFLWDLLNWEEPHINLIAIVLFSILAFYFWNKSKPTTAMLPIGTPEELGISEDEITMIE